VVRVALEANDFEIEVFQLSFKFQDGSPKWPAELLMGSGIQVGANA
jgi:hypothetical protein